MKVDECPAGPAMDAAVAKAAGWISDWLYDCDGLPKRIRYVDSRDGYKEVWADIRDWHPSTDIAVAEILWDRLVEDDWVMSVCYGPGRDGRRYASVQMQLDKFLAVDLMTRNPRDMDAKADTKALAICRAFLKANGVTEIDCGEK